MRGWSTLMRFIDFICRAISGAISRRTTMVIRMITTP